VGNATNWTQQPATTPAKVHTLAYDAAGQLTSAKVTGPNPLPVPSRFGYAYDAAGNRTTEQLDDVATGATYNSRNELTSRQAGGALLFRGTVNEPATVTLAGKPTQVDTSNTFQGTATVPTGTSTVAVAATDASGNTRTNTYQVTESGSPVNYTYDANGNLTGDGVRTFEWDAEKRLFAVNTGANRSEFTYDGRNRRVRIVEKQSGNVTSNKRFLWCGNELCEERDATGAAVTRRFFRHGFVEAGSPFFYTIDHLGSVREVTDSSGAVRARYDYDLFGRTTQVSGDKVSSFTYAGYYSHPPSGLLLTLRRAYAADTARWLSEDPITWQGGANFYAYVLSNPVAYADPLGLQAKRPPFPPPGVKTPPLPKQFPCPNKKNCDPNKIQDDIDSVKHQMNRMQNGQPPKGTVVGSTVTPITCDPQGNCTNNPQDPKNFDPGTNEKDPCVRYCITVHEWVHFNDNRPWNLNWPDAALVIYWEWPAYEANLACLESFD